MRFIYLLMIALLPALAQAQVPFNRSRDIVNLSSLPYTPAVLADWDGAADPGDADDATDQIAERVKDIETVAAQGRLLTGTAAAEAANVRVFTVDIDDLLGVDAAATRIRVRLFTDAVMMTAAAPAAFTLTDGGDGTLESTAAATTTAIFLSGASTRVQIAVTDVAGASGATVYGTVEVLGAGPVFSATLRFTFAFDGA